MSTVNADVVRTDNAVEELQKAVTAYVLADTAGDVETLDELEPATARLVQAALAVGNPAVGRAFAAMACCPRMPRN